ncbi:hypothetical protein [Corynebacterium poyangense]
MTMKAIVNETGYPLGTVHRYVHMEE